MKKTVLITGGTGYIGSWVTKDLLEKGYTVRLTMRDKSKKHKYQHLLDIESKTAGTLELWEADLLAAGAFHEPAEGCAAIIHIASPFILQFKNAQKELIDPAVKGTQNVLNAATASSTVEKVVLTSSVAAVFGDNIDMKTLGIDEFTEAHFNTTSSVIHQPYSYSKVAAEQAAWKLQEAQSQWKLVVINPSFVMGPSLTQASDSGSLTFMKEMLTGKYYFGAPNIPIGFVDVRDVAQAHILALESESAEGRHILAERTASLYQFSKLIGEVYPKRFKLPLMQAPKIVMHLSGWMFGLTAKYISRNVNHEIKLNASKSREKLGLIYRPLKVTIENMVSQMQESNSIK